jgi:hypothetical protein
LSKGIDSGVANKTSEPTTTGKGVGDGEIGDGSEESVNGSTGEVSVQLALTLVQAMLPTIAFLTALATAT